MIRAALIQKTAASSSDLNRQGGHGHSRQECRIENAQSLERIETTTTCIIVLVGSEVMNSIPKNRDPGSNFHSRGTAHGVDGGDGKAKTF
jgi:hypothetical protein